MHAGMLCLESKGAIITETFFLGGGEVRNEVGQDISSFYTFMHQLRQVLFSKVDQSFHKV